RSPRPDFCAEVGITQLELDEVLERSDYVILTVSATPETRHLIGARELGLMKDSAALINIARGSVVDEQALITALPEATIAAAGPPRAPASGRRPRTGPDEGLGRADQHRPRQRRRRAGPDHSAAGGHHRRSRPGRVRGRAAARRQPPDRAGERGARPALAVLDPGLHRQHRRRDARRGHRHGRRTAAAQRRELPAGRPRGCEVTHEHPHDVGGERSAAGQRSRAEERAVAGERSVVDEARITELTTVVTGVASTRGIGRGVARVLAGEGRPLALLDRDTDGLEEAAEQARAAGASLVVTAQADIADPASVDTAITDVESAAPPVAALVT